MQYDWLHNRQAQSHSLCVLSHQPVLPDSFIRDKKKEYHYICEVNQTQLCATYWQYCQLLLDDG